MSVKEDVPRDLIERAECVAVIPGVKKAAAGVGARFGYGAVSCRSEGGFGPWGPPLMISLKGGSFGCQVGGQEADLVPRPGRGDRRLEAVAQTPQPPDRWMLAPFT